MDVISVSSKTCITSNDILIPHWTSGEKGHMFCNNQIKLKNWVKMVTIIVNLWFCRGEGGRESGPIISSCIQTLFTSTLMSCCGTQYSNMENLLFWEFVYSQIWNQISLANRSVYYIKCSQRLAGDFIHTLVSVSVCCWVAMHVLGGSNMTRTSCV